MSMDEERERIEQAPAEDEGPEHTESVSTAEDGDKASRKKLLLNTGLPVLLTIIFFLIPLFSKTPVYALNDDIQIRDILSGAYGGSPDLHTVYMGAVLSGILAFLYTVLPFVPWYGLFLCAAPAAVFLIVSLKIMKSEKALFIKALVLCMLSGLCLWLMYPLYIMPHYTLVAAVFAAGALWLMMDRDMTGGVILLLICQQVRQQVFLMLVPFAAAVILLTFIEDKEKRSGLKKPLLIFAAGFAALFIINAIAYAGSTWRDYLKLNDARTQLYDYTGVWESSAAREHYAQAGVSREDYPFYREYDLLPVKGADTATLKAMADYREEGRQPAGMERFKDVIRSLGRFYLTSNGKEMVYAMGLVLMYALALSNSFLRGKGWGVLFSIGCFIMHLVLHGYLLWRGRVPERVTVSLIMAQCFMLGGMVLRYTEEWRQVYYAIEGAILTIVLSQAYNATAGLNDAYAEQITVNNEDDVLYSYMAQNPDELFVMETYATVYHTAYVTDTDRVGNTMIMGGWQYLSPLQDKKLKSFGFDDRFDMFVKGGIKIVFRKGDGPETADMDVYLNKEYGTGLKLTEQLPGDFMIFAVE